MNMITIIKVGGKELDDTAFLNEVCKKGASLDQQAIFVHGGGKEISAAMERYGQTVSFVEGIRVTPPESMAVMEMVVCGSINKRIVAKLVAAGRKAIGLSGVDVGLVRCVPYRPHGIDLQRVGEITAVDVVTLQAMLSLGWLPVLAPVALGQDDGLPYNINADHMALGVAVATNQHGIATELVFVSNVAGVVIGGQVVDCLTASEIAQAIQSGDITDGMVPKVRSALGALEAGVAAARITNLKGLETGGTRIIR